MESSATGTDAVSLILRLDDGAGGGGGGDGGDVKIVVDVGLIFNFKDIIGECTCKLNKIIYFDFICKFKFFLRLNL